MIRTRSSFATGRCIVGPGGAAHVHAHGEVGECPDAQRARDRRTTSAPRGIVTLRRPPNRHGAEATRPPWPRRRPAAPDGHPSRWSVAAAPKRFDIRSMHHAARRGDGFTTRPHRLVARTTGPAMDGAVPHAPTQCVPTQRAPAASPIGGPASATTRAPSTPTASLVRLRNSPVICLILHRNLGRRA